jgi:hypothetical protein
MSKTAGADGDFAATYEGLEDPTSFPTPASLERYRRGLLARTAPQADFLTRHLPPAARILEIAEDLPRQVVIGERLRGRGAISEGSDRPRRVTRGRSKLGAGRAPGRASLQAADALRYELP